MKKRIVENPRGSAILRFSGRTYPQPVKKIGLDMPRRPMSNCAFIFASEIKGINHETHLSTLGCSPQAHPRLPRPHAYQGWPQGHRRSPRQGPSSSGRLNADGQAAAASAGGKDRGTKPFAFPKRYRLTKTDEYSSVFGFRRAVKSAHFLLHYRPRAEGEPTRLGIVVAKRLQKSAVGRNLIKRIAREQFRLLRSQLPAMDLILRLNAKWQVLERRQVAGEIAMLLQKLDAASHRKSQ